MCLGGGSCSWQKAGSKYHNNHGILSHTIGLSEHCGHSDRQLLSPGSQAERQTETFPSLATQDPFRTGNDSRVGKVCNSAELRDPPQKAMCTPCGMGELSANAAVGNTVSHPHRKNKGGE